MHSLKLFSDDRFDRLNAIIESLGGHVNSYINLIGSATLPLPEVCEVGRLPATACRVEGHLGQRYFPATDPMDQAELLVAEKTKRLFGLGKDYGVNAQPHSATQANHAVFRAVLSDRTGPVAGLKAVDGGHISHKFGVPSSHEFVALPASGDGIDYDEVRKTVRAKKPAILVVGGSSYTRGVDYAKLRQIADVAGAHLHADLAHTAPFVAAGLHPAVFPYADSATIDPSKNLRGPRGGILVYRSEDKQKMDRAIFPGLQSSPNQSGLLAKAACLSYWSIEELAEYAERMVTVARAMGGSIGNLLGEPIYGGTDSHLLLFDVAHHCGDGREAEGILEGQRILANRNQVPGDPLPPWKSSGIRLSSTIPTILNYTDQDVTALGEAIGQALTGVAGYESTVARLLTTYHKETMG